MADNLSDISSDSGSIYDDGNMDIEESPPPTPRAATTTVVSSSSDASSGSDAVKTASEPEVKEVTDHNEVEMIGIDDDAKMKEVHENVHKDKDLVTEKRMDASVENVVDGVIKMLNQRNMDVDLDNKTRAEESNVDEVLLRRIGRKELEEIILRKVIECIHSTEYSQIGDLREKYLHLKAFKDKLVLKVVVLQNQLKELARVVALYGENAATLPEKQIQARPLKFYRSVGLQVCTDATTRTSVSTGANASVLTRYNVGGGDPLLQTIPGKNKSPRTGPKKPLTTTYSPRGRGRPRGSPMMMKRVQAGFGRPLPDPPKLSRINFTTTPPTKYPGQRIAMRNPAAQAAQDKLTALQFSKHGRKTISESQKGFIDICEIAAASAASGKTNISELIDLTVENLDSGEGGEFALNKNEFGINNADDFFPSNSSLVSIIGNCGTVTPSPLKKQPVPIRTVYRLIRSSNRDVEGRNDLASANGKDLDVVMVEKPIPFVPEKKTFKLPAVPGPTKPSSLLYLGTDEPPKPKLTLTGEYGKIVMSWTYEDNVESNLSKISTYEIFTYQQPLNIPNVTNLALPPTWIEVGQVLALPLPMSCTLSEFLDDKIYFFILRGLDIYNRSGPFCNPVSIVLRNSS